MSIAIVVIEGEGAVNIIQQETSVAVLKYGGGSSRFDISMTGLIPSRGHAPATYD